MDCRVKPGNDGRFLSKIGRCSRTRQNGNLLLSRLRQGGAALATILLLGTSAYGFGPTITLREPSGMDLSSLPTRPPIVRNNALDSPANAVFLFSSVNESEFAWSSGEIEGVARITPLCHPPTTNIVGLSLSPFTRIGFGSETVHPAAMRLFCICSASVNASESSRKYNISTLAFGCCDMAALNIVRSIIRGPICLRNCSVFNSAAATLSLDSRRSFSQYHSFTFVVPMIKIVDITPATRLATNTTFAQSAIRLADSRESQEPHTRLPLWFFVGAIVIVFFAGVAGIAFILWVFRWKR